MKNQLLLLLLSMAATCLAGETTEPVITNAIGSTQGDDSSLQATFIDIKLNRKGKKSDIGELLDSSKSSFTNRQEAGAIVAEFINKKWSSKTLAQYHIHPTKLYSNYVYIPSCHPSYIPSSFQIEKEDNKGNWFIYYKGTVRAPKTGDYRFVAIANSGIYVRFNKKLVLEAGNCIPTLALDKKEKYSYTCTGVSSSYHDKISSYKGHEGYKFYPMGTDPLKGYVGGNIINVKEGKEYPIEILVTETKGEYFFANLFIEDINKATRKDGVRIFDLFRTCDELPDSAKIEEQIKDARYHANYYPYKEFTEDSPSWGIESKSKTQSKK